MTLNPLIWQASPHPLVPMPGSTASPVPRASLLLLAMPSGARPAPWVSMSMLVNGCSIRVPLDSIMVVSGTPDEAEACLGAVYIKPLSPTPLPAPLKDMTLNVSIWQARLLLQTLHGAMTALQVCTRPS